MGILTLSWSKFALVFVFIFIECFFLNIYFEASKRCISINIKYSFFTCTHHHVPFYNKYGLTLFPGIAPFDNAVFGTQYVIFGTDLNIENKIQTSIKTLRLQLEEEKQDVMNAVVEAK